MIRLFQQHVPGILFLVTTAVRMTNTRTENGMYFFTTQMCVSRDFFYCDSLFCVLFVTFAVVFFFHFSTFSRRGLLIGSGLCVLWVFSEIVEMKTTAEWLLEVGISRIPARFYPQSDLVSSFAPNQQIDVATAARPPPSPPSPSPPTLKTASSAKKPRVCSHRPDVCY